MRKYIGFILLFVVIIISPFVFSPAKAVFMYLSKPFIITFDKIGDVFVSSPLNFFVTIHSIKNLTAENESLRQQVRQLETDQSAVIEIEKENENLRKQLGFVQSQKNLSLIPAEVVGKSPNNLMQYLILNQGEKAGIKVGQAVVYEGILVGKIEEVSQNTAKVFSISNPTAAVPVITQDSRAVGLIRGEIDYGLVIEDVSKDVALIPGENIITSGLGQEYPRGLLVGKIDKVLSQGADLFQKASVKTLIDSAKLEMVFVIK